LLSLSLVGLLSCGGGEDAPFASAFVMAELGEGVGGPKAMARPGDFLLENDHFRVAVLSARNSMGAGLFGGSLIDADIRRSHAQHGAGEGNDRLAETFPTVSMNVARPDPENPESIRIISDGSKKGEPAVVRVSGPGIPFITLLDALWALVGSPDVWITTDYIVEPGVPWVTMRTTGAFFVDHEVSEGQPAEYWDSAMPLIDLAIEDGAAFGEFYLQGGSVDVFAPGTGFDEDGAVFEAMDAGQNTFVTPFEYPFLAGVADGVSYGIAPAEGSIFVPLFTASQTVAVGASAAGNPDPDLPRFPPGEAYTYERYFFIGHGDVASIVDQYLAAREIDGGTVTGQVIEEVTGLPVSDIDVFVYEPGAEKPWSQFRTDVHPDDALADGSFTGQLPVGDWELAVHNRGRPAGKRVQVSVKKNKELTVSLAARRGGVLSFTVRDETGQEVPAKVSVFRLDNDPVRDPVLGDGHIGGRPEAVVFATYGHGQVELAPGRYQAVATRGVEYEIDESEPFTVDVHQGADLDLTVLRTVDTTGWIGADFHVHAVPSHDSGVTLEKRVSTMVAEGVEFFSSTDHDHVTDYAPTVEAMDLEFWLQTAVGNEVTSVEVGHFLAFPLAHDFLGDRGADAERLDWTDKNPTQMMADMQSLGEEAGFDPLVFVGHPRDGILGYFDQFGFNPYLGAPGRAGVEGTTTIETPLLSNANPLLVQENFSWQFDALELFNGKRFDYLRTPTSPEMAGYAAGDGTNAYDWITRTIAEQDDMLAGTYPLGYGHDGVIDDWFALLNLGFKFTALANSDTHGTTSVESGCPRNFVLLDADDPQNIDDQEVADAVKAHRVVASYGPFIEFEVDGQPIGSELVEAGPIELDIRIQAPSWMGVDRVELYENGSIIQEWALVPGDEIIRFEETVPVTPTKDSWYVVITMGDSDLAPLFTPVEFPPIELTDVVTEALAGVEAISSLLEAGSPVPQVFPVRPFAMTNPIWIDQAGDGFDAPGFPAWWVEPEVPETSTTSPTL
jgi:hypothetical protein